MPYTFVTLVVHTMGVYCSIVDAQCSSPSSHPWRTVTTDSASGSNNIRNMRKVIASEYVSLDGIMEDPAWTAPY